MKTYFLIFSLFCSFAVLSQAAPTEKIKIKISHFVKSKTIKELIPLLPKNCPISEFQFSIDSPQLKKTIKLKNNKISSDLKSIVKKMKVGQKFYIENIKSNCKTSFKNKHIFVII